MPSVHWFRCLLVPWFVVRRPLKEGPNRRGLFIVLFLWISSLRSLILGLSSAISSWWDWNGDRHSACMEKPHACDTESKGGVGEGEERRGNQFEKAMKKSICRQSRLCWNLRTRWVHCDLSTRMESRRLTLLPLSRATWRNMKTTSRQHLYHQSFVACKLFARSNFRTCQEMWNAMASNWQTC